MTDGQDYCGNYDALNRDYRERATWNIYDRRPSWIIPELAQSAHQNFLTAPLRFSENMETNMHTLLTYAKIPQHAECHCDVTRGVQKWRHL